MMTSTTFFAPELGSFVATSHIPCLGRNRRAGTGRHDPAATPPRSTPMVPRQAGQPRRRALAELEATIRQVELAVAGQRGAAERLVALGWAGSRPASAPAMLGLMEEHLARLRRSREVLAPVAA